jgi:AraC family transcriptional regulator
LEPPKELAVSGSTQALDHYSKLSPHIYVLRRSVECALNLLKQETVTLTEVYQDSGFETEVQFVKAFCDMIGVTPSLYRENVLIAKSVAGGRTRAR